MNEILANCYTVPEMAQRLALTEESLRNHKLPEIKASCTYYKWGRKLYVNKAHFHRYEDKQMRQAENKVNRAV